MSTRTLSGLSFATLDPTAFSAPAQPVVPAPAPAPSTIDLALEVVLERTRRGDEELIRHRFGLGAARWQLLAAIDGVRALGVLTQPGAYPGASRLVSDAARLVAFGLCRSVRGELPRSFMIAAMNLTMRLPRALIPAGAPAQSRPAAPPPVVLDTPQRDSDTRRLHLAAAIVAVLLLAWIVFEIARS